jgi:hypothetical protein
LLKVYQVHQGKLLYPAFKIHVIACSWYDFDTFPEPDMLIKLADPILRLEGIHERRSYQ